MAAKDKKSIAKTSDTDTKVTRISARDDTKPKKPVKKEAMPATQSAPRRNMLAKIATPFSALGGYFKGAWYELTQVHWPNRRATWEMTGALVGFTAFFVVVILLLDALFKYLFELILG